METESDGAGVFHLSGLSMRRHMVRASLGEQSAQEPCLIYDHAPVAELILVMSTNQGIAGIVRDEDGNPVAGAQLYPLIYNGKPVARYRQIGNSTNSDQEGHFAFDALDEGQWEFYAMAEGYSATLSAPFPTGTTDGEIVLKSGVLISGQVLKDGAAASEVRVSLSREGLPAPPLITLSSRDGSFAYAAVAPGSYSLSATKGDAVLVDSPLNLAVGTEPVTDLSLNLVTGGILRGTLTVRETEAGIPGVSVQAVANWDKSYSLASAPSDASGHFEIVGLTAGKYTITPGRPPGFKVFGVSNRERDVHIEPGQVVEGFSLVLSQGVTISGQVLDLEGEPVSGAKVRGSGRGWQDQQVSDREGHYTLAGLRAGHRVHVQTMVSNLASEIVGPLDVPQNGLDGVDLILGTPRHRSGGRYHRGYAWSPGVGPGQRLDPRRRILWGFQQCIDGWGGKLRIAEYGGGHLHPRREGRRQRPPELD